MEMLDSLSYLPGGNINSISILIERLFWGGIGVFLFGAISSQLKKLIKKP